MPILIVEDDDSVARFLKQAIEEAGYATQTEWEGEQALRVALDSPFDLILLDVMLPGLDGFSICRQLRASKIASPILIITAKDTLNDKIAGLDAGADDYIVKPFQVGELLARVRALLRRVKSAHTDAVLSIGGLTLDATARKATKEGKPLALSATEFALLEFLMRNSGKPLTRLSILQHVWEYDFEGKDNVLDVYISYLRNKIDSGRTSSLIKTIRGTGYQFEETNGS